MQNYSFSPIRLTASENGETKCVIFVDSSEHARKMLEPHVSTIVAAYPFLKAFGAHVSVHKLEDLARLPCVRAVAPHTTCRTCLFKTNRVLNVDFYRPVLGYGEDITAAVIDTGIRPHLDFTVPENRIIFKDFIGGEALPYDDNGHGTAVSSILCGNGLFSGGRYAGIAPRARVAALKAIGVGGEGGAFAILEAMQWICDNAREFNIKVVCMSFGSEPVVGAIDPLSAGAEALWKRGITVVTSAGNDGPAPRTIRSPGCNPYVITVGGAQIEGVGLPPSVASFSSRGPCGRFSKPDLIAPSLDIIACGHIAAYDTFSGTSMAAPMVAGAAALLLSRHPELSPNRIKELLLNYAQKLPLSPVDAGRGMLSFEGLGARG
ncbi:MAG: S8 family serine peptidase [Firmicutes bacterium]|nr:S8 family serine peptidase [Bacillota bacterium]